MYYLIYNTTTGKYLQEDEGRGCYSVEEVSLDALIRGVRFDRTGNYKFGFYDTKEDAEGFLDAYFSGGVDEEDEEGLQAERDQYIIRTLHLVVE